MSTSESTAGLTVDQAQRLREIVLEVLELEPEELTDVSLFVEDHDADSLLAIEILARIEQDLGVSIPQEELAEMTNLAKVREMTARNLGTVG